LSLVQVQKRAKNFLQGHSLYAGQNSREPFAEKESLSIYVNPVTLSIFGALMKLSISLNKSKASAGLVPALSRSSAFGNTDEDDDNYDTPSTLPSSDGKTSVNKVVLAQNMQTSKATRKRMEAEKQVDSTVYEYDEVWDKMQEAKVKAKTAKEQESRERKVCV